jgi:hypothetical protein
MRINAQITDFQESTHESVNTRNGYTALFASELASFATPRRAAKVEKDVRMMAAICDVRNVIQGTEIVTASAQVNQPALQHQPALQQLKHLFLRGCQRKVRNF